MAMQERDGRAVVGYIRVSTEEQAQSGFGLGVQEERVRAYGQALGLPLTEVIADDGYSGGTLERPGLQGLLERMRSGDVGTVVIAKLDRLSRSLRNLLNLYAEDFETYGVALVSVAEQFDTSSPTGRLFFQIVGSFAEYERNVITDRTSGGRKAKAKTGGYAGGRPAFGYRAARGDHALLVDDDEAATVRRVFELHGQGASLRSIARTLNGEERTTAQGAMWTAVQVSRVLQRQALYEGRYTYSGIEAEEGKQDAILS